MSIQIYGISQCNTVKKARKWLTDQHINAEFIDYKKISPTITDIQFWLTQVPKETLINRKGTTWRRLSNNEQTIALSNDDEAIRLMINHPSVIKRPVLVKNPLILVGFDPQRYTEFFA